MGWGSMTCKAPGTVPKLAVMAAGCRTIVLSGWTGLSADVLRASADGAAELAYAESGRMIFVQSVAHEWLFLRVRAVVHHGGAGTLNASLRAEVPCVVIACARLSTTTHTLPRSSA
jgi:sterol 3beta-glucosyltransferase